MTATVSAEQATKFENVFRKPTIADMLAMEPFEFEQFIVYVFTCGGYRAEYVGDKHWPKGPGVDIELYTTQAGRIPAAKVEVRRYDPDRPIGFDDVKAFAGILAITGGIHGYLVTTGTFHANARSAEAAAEGKVRLVDGAQLLRYITYIRGSRIKDSTGQWRTASPTPPNWLTDAMPLARRNPKDTTILAVANNKGGVAKTTTALNVGLALAREGRRVLLVDMDGQASLSLALPLPDPEMQAARRPRRNQVLGPVPSRQRHISEYFSGQTASLTEIVQPTRFENVWLLPANEELHRMDTGGTARTDLELAFTENLHTPHLQVPPSQHHPGPFDWIVLDTPPAQTMYTRVALAAAHYVLIPAVIEPFSARGVNRVFETVTAMNALSGSNPTIAGCVITKWRSSATVTKELPLLQAELDAKQIHLFKAQITLDDKIDQAHLSTIGGGHKILFGFNGSQAARDYEKLLEQFIERVRPHVNESR